MRKSTVWTLRKVSTRISLGMPYRRNRIYTFRLLWIFCFSNNYSIYPPLDGMCRPGQSARTAQDDLVDTLRRCVSPQLHFAAFEKMCRHVPTVPKRSYAPDKCHLNRRNRYLLLLLLLLLLFRNTYFAGYYYILILSNITVWYLIRRHWKYNK